MSAFFSPLFSWGTKARIVREWFYRAGDGGSESTVAEFVQRHYGREMVERVADPLLAGVYGGAADELSVKSVFPRFLEMEARHGSLGRAMVAARRRTGASVPAPSPSLFTSLRPGMGTMVDGLLGRISAAARRLNARIEAVRPESGKWLVVSSGRTE
jgi:oxygen-dependent protoporphyrinogen oxidase